MPPWFRVVVTYMEREREMDSVVCNNPREGCLNTQPEVVVVRVGRRDGWSSFLGHRIERCW